MQWYFIILIFFLNILLGICLFYSLLMIFFHPKKKIKIFCITLPQGLLYILKNKLVNYISKQFEIYIESSKEDFENSKIAEITKKLSHKIVEKVEKNKWFKLLPDFIGNPILKFISDISYYFFEELLTNFTPNLIKKYKMKEKIFEFFSNRNIEFIELKAKLYLTKPMAIIGGILGLIFGIFNMILLLIF
ncbi:MAG: hypothetical protein ISS28_08575 [Candidatus Cloacimonetes bacterium]|nr:hypothetical protein [Candidatus Cloacimonadota bacterium]